MTVGLAQLAASVKSPLGMNLAQITSGSTEIPFLDHFKSNSGWYLLTGGDSATVTIDIPSSTFTWPAHGKSNGCAIAFTTTGALAAGVAPYGSQGANPVFYVVAATTSTFQVAHTSGGPAITLSGTQSGTHTAFTGLQWNLQTDANGWPTSTTLAHGAGTWSQLQTFFHQGGALVDGSPSWPQGTYVLLYKGPGPVVMTDDAGPPTSGGTAADGSTRVIYNVSGTTQITCKVTGVANSIRFVSSPGSTAGGTIGVNEAALLAGERISPEFKAKVRLFSVFRFMDWQLTMQAAVTDWASRTPADYYSYSIGAFDGAYTSGPTSGWVPGTTANHGVPYEAIVATCNETNTNCWINVPFMASDAYVAAMAAYFRDHLNLNLKVYVEYGNEKFNFAWAFWIDNYLRSLFAPFGVGSTSAAILVRAVQVADIWASAYSGQMSRLVRVLGLQAGNSVPPNGGANGADMDLTDAAVYSLAASTHFDAGSVAHYMPNVFAWQVPYAWSADANPYDKLFQELNVGVVPTATPFTGSISGTVLTVASIDGLSGPKIAVGQTITGANVTAGTTVSSPGTGTGGAGTYNLSASQTVGSETMQAFPGPTTSGGTSAYTVTSGQSLSAPANGTIVPVVINQASVSGATIAVDSVAALKMRFGDGTDGVISAGPCNLVYTNATRDGPVSPAEWRAIGMGPNPISGGGGSVKQATDLFARDVAAIQARGLIAVSYEGGLNVNPPSFSANLTIQSSIVNWLDGMARDPRMGQVYKAMYTTLRAAGGAPLLHYIDAIVPTPPNMWGSLWGANQDPITAPRYVALRDFR